MDKLIVIMPLYNEIENLQDSVSDWHSLVTAIGAESRLLIIDDGSNDGSSLALDRLKACYAQLDVVHKTNSGHGPTVRLGYALALQMGADYIFMTDSDGQTSTHDFVSFWQQRSPDSAQLGWRKHREDGPGRVLVSFILRIIILILFGKWVIDPNCPYRLYSRSCLTKLLPFIHEQSLLPNVLLNVLIRYTKLNYSYWPIRFRKRQKGENSIHWSNIKRIGFAAVREFMGLRGVFRNLSR